jgi:hypothetical protein
LSNYSFYEFLSEAASRNQQTGTARLPHLAHARGSAAESFLPGGGSPLRTSICCHGPPAGLGFPRPFYLRQPAIAKMIVEAIRYNADTLGHYLLVPSVALPKLTKSLKGITARRANILPGNSFWQQES